MKELFRILRESDKLGYKLSAICGVNWLVGQLFRWQSLVFESYWIFHFKRMNLYYGF